MGNSARMRERRNANSSKLRAKCDKKHRWEDNIRINFEIKMREV
jgi:hypothetical protein